MCCQKYHEGFWNGRNLVPKAGIIANGYSHQRSIEDRTDHDHHKVSVRNLSADSAGVRILCSHYRVVHFGMFHLPCLIGIVT